MDQRPRQASSLQFSNCRLPFLLRPLCESDGISTMGFPNMDACSALDRRMDYRINPDLEALTSCSLVQGNFLLLVVPGWLRTLLYRNRASVVFQKQDRSDSAGRRTGEERISRHLS